MSTFVIDNQPPSLKGGMLWMGALVLAMANFLAVLNMTIANVTQPNMAGALGAGTSQGTGSSRPMPLLKPLRYRYQDG
jgi:DHA2 family multidrug resistance protein